LHGRRPEKRPGCKKKRDNYDNEFLNETASDGDGSLLHNSLGSENSNDVFEDDK
jgi:hypothetical protein